MIREKYQPLLNTHDMVICLVGVDQAHYHIQQVPAENVTTNETHQICKQISNLSFTYDPKVMFLFVKDSFILDMHFPSRYNINMPAGL